MITQDIEPTPAPLRLLARAIHLCVSGGDYLDAQGRIVPRDSVPPPHDCDGVRYVQRRARLLTAILGYDCDGTHIPKGASRVVDFDGIVFRIELHKPHAEINTCTGKPWKSSRHRVFVDCPVCGKQIPVGRLHQHAVVHRDGK